MALPSRRLVPTLALAWSLALASAALSNPCTTAYCELKSVLAAEVQAGNISTEQVAVVIDQVNRLAMRGESSPLVLGTDGRLVRSAEPSRLELTIAETKLAPESLDLVVRLTRSYLAQPQQK